MPLVELGWLIIGAAGADVNGMVEIGAAARYPPPGELPRRTAMLEEQDARRPVDQ